MAEAYPRAVRHLAAECERVGQQVEVFLAVAGGEGDGALVFASATVLRELCLGCGRLLALSAEHAEYEHACDVLAYCAHEFGEMAAKMTLAEGMRAALAPVLEAARVVQSLANAVLCNVSGRDLAELQPSYLTRDIVVHALDVNILDERREDCLLHCLGAVQVSSEAARLGLCTARPSPALAHRVLAMMSVTAAARTALAHLSTGSAQIYMAVATIGLYGHLARSVADGQAPGPVARACGEAAAAAFGVLQNVCGAGRDA